MTGFWLWVFLLLVYLLCGQLFALCYILAYRPADKTAWLGLLCLLWPLVVVIDAVLSIAAGFGSVARKLAERANRLGAAR